MKTIFSFSIALLLFCSSCHRHQDTEARQFVHRKLSNDVLVILDPGHGGKDSGAKVTFDKRYLEKDFALALARIVKNHLSNLGYRVVMTRNSDRFVSLPSRVRMANSLRQAVFISLHLNASKNSEAEGVEVFYHRSLSSERRLSSKNLATSVLDHIIQYTQAESRGVRFAKFEVLRKTVMPAVLVEGGFLTNEDELDNLREVRYLHALSWGISKGIDYYLN